MDEEETKAEVEVTDAANEEAAADAEAEERMQDDEYDPVAHMD